MSDGNLYQCKGPTAGGATCGVIKGSVNHWYLVWTDNGNFGSAPFDAALIDSLKLVEIEPLWVCGQSCAQKFYERYLATGKLN